MVRVFNKGLGDPPFYSLAFQKLAEWSWASQSFSASPISQGRRIKWRLLYAGLSSLEEEWDYNVLNKYFSAFLNAKDMSLKKRKGTIPKQCLDKGECNQLYCIFYYQTHATTINPS